MALQGDTVRLKVHFKTFEGVSIEPSNIELVIYDNKQEEVETLLVDALTNEGTGQYYCDYEISDDIFEFFIFEYGGLHNDKSILSRGKVDIQFTK
ncbi:hypothetical protein ACUL41_06995 [Virgibacillus natechei]